MVFSHPLKTILYNPTLDKLLIISNQEIIYLLSLSTFTVDKQIVGFHDEVKIKKISADLLFRYFRRQLLEEHRNLRVILL